MALKLSIDAADCLAQHHVMTLATQGDEGPWAAAVFYVPVGDDLVFLSSPSSRHCRNLAQQPRCAATIQSEYEDWRAVQGIQMVGEVSELIGGERSFAQGLYAERFPVVQPANAPPVLLAALARVRWYRLRISSLYFIDNSRGFGLRQRFDV